MGVQGEGLDLEMGVQGLFLPKAESKTGVKGPNGVIGAQERVRRGVGGQRGVPAPPGGGGAGGLGGYGEAVPTLHTRGHVRVPLGGVSGVRSPVSVRQGLSVRGGCRGTAVAMATGAGCEAGGCCSLPPARRRSVPPHRGRGEAGGDLGRLREVEREGGSRHNGVGLGGPPVLMLPASNKEAPALGRPSGSPPGLQPLLPPNPSHFPLSPVHPSSLQFPPVRPPLSYVLSPPFV